MNLPFQYPIQIEHIYISPGHNYFGRPKDGPGAHLTQDVDQVRARAGLGLEGDRFYGVAAHYDAQVTFFAAEVFDALLARFDLSDLTPVLTRRNVITRGVNLNQLLGEEFVVECGEERVRFLGRKPCSPCAWMDAAIQPGAHSFLRGRGGIRARILEDGVLHRGPATLYTRVEQDMSALTEPLPRPRLP